MCTTHVCSHSGTSSLAAGAGSSQGRHNGYTAGPLHAALLPGNQCSIRPHCRCDAAPAADILLSIGTLFAQAADTAQGPCMLHNAHRDMPHHPEVTLTANPASAVDSQSVKGDFTFWRRALHYIVSVQMLTACWHTLTCTATGATCSQPTQATMR